MPNAATFRDIISGRRSGLTAFLARAFLSFAEYPYYWGVAWRNRRYDQGGQFVQKMGVPVVSVGNLTMGGTGKTPMVEWLARWFSENGLRVALVSRGYGASTGRQNDEAMELARKLPHVPHVQNRDRVAAARTVIEKHQAQVILMDDGFQHRRLHRDLDIVLIDALDPFGNNRLVPRGILREPIANLRRAHVVALSRADLVSENDRNTIRKVVEEHAPNAAWIEVTHAPTHLVSASGDSMPVDSLQGNRIAAFCGIGNPAGFRRTLEKLNCTIADFREFPDHHPYSAADIADLSTWLQNDPEISNVLCTLKDLVKIDQDQIGPMPLKALVVGLKIQAGESLLVKQLEAISEQCRLRDQGERP